MLSLITSPFKALITWRVKSPLFLSFNREELFAYFQVNELHYRWQRTPTGVTGTCDRGFGRHFDVVWTEADKSILLVNRLERHILFYHHRHEAVLKVTLHDGTEASRFGLMVGNFANWTTNRP